MKILVLPYTHALSHISRPLLVAEELRRRGHEVVFAGEGPKVRFIRDAGFQVLPVYEPDPAILFGNIRKGKMRFVTDEVIEEMVEADLALFKEVGPCIVLTDGRFSARISTHIAGIKHVAIVNVSSTEYRAEPYIPFLDFIPDSLHIGKARDLLNLKLEISIFDRVMSVFKRLSRQYGIKTLVTATNCLTGKDYTLLPDIPEYFPTKNLPDNYSYIGPITWNSRLPGPHWWPPKKDGRELVYITMGTTGVADFFEKIYDLFKASEFLAIITTGAQSGKLRTTEGKIYVEDFMDGDLAIEASELVVCHGGNGTIYQALQHGRPVIGIPTIPDQKFNMRRVEALGLGKTLFWKDFEKSPERLLDLIKEVLADSSVRENVVRFRELSGKYDAPRIAADIIEGLG
ncbi:Putative glycosyl transferase [hydrothermal vent metagenome]|uniref:Glycosyl transferase n=1 Tax=hydrothermal vent metagenome TaxID=652676 RepID=A0A3B0R7D2_9ZZZZ